MSAVLQFDMSLAYVECCNCSIVFALPANLDKRLRQDGSYFYCPNGHSQHYSASEISKLQTELEAAKQRIAFERNQRESAERQLAATKGQITKFKHRVKQGICPVCKRNFVALGRHIRGQHPGFGGE